MLQQRGFFFWAKGTSQSQPSLREQGRRSLPLESAAVVMACAALDLPASSLRGMLTRRLEGCLAFSSIIHGICVSVCTRVYVCGVDGCVPLMSEETSPKVVVGRRCQATEWDAVFAILIKGCAVRLDVLHLKHCGVSD